MPVKTCLFPKTPWHKSKRAKPYCTNNLIRGGWHVARNWDLHSWDYRAVLRQLHSSYGATPFFKITVEPDPDKPTLFAIRIAPSGLSLPDRSFYYADDDNPVVKAYKRLLKDVVIVFRTTSSEAQKFSSNIFNFEKRIAEVTPDTALLQNPVNTNNPITLGELKITAPSIALRDILVSIFPDVGIEDSTSVLVSSPDYLIAISEIISSSDKAALNNYMIWTLVKTYLPFLSTQFTDELGQYTAEKYGVKAQRERWETCALLVRRFMGIAVEALLDRQHPISNSSEVAVNSLFASIKLAAVRQIKSAHLPYDLDRHLKKKASSLALQISVPQNFTSDEYLRNYYLKLHVSKSSLFMNIVNGMNFLKNEKQMHLLQAHPEYRLLPYISSRPLKASYCGPANTVVVPRGLLREPHFDPKYPTAVIYGRLGLDIAEAVISALLPYESFWKTEKLLTLHHISVNESVKYFGYQTKCLMSFVRNENLGTAEVANLTSLSTLKHLSSLRLAFAALSSVVNDDLHVHQPTLEFLEDSALYFLTYAQRQCSLSTPQQQALDNTVDFKLSSKPLLQVAWAQVPEFMSSLQCERNNKRCSDIF